MHKVNVLSQAEVENFHLDGVIVPKFRLPADKLSLLQELADKLIVDNPQMGDEPITSPHVPNSGIQGVKSDPRWIEIPTFPPIVDIVEQLIGPDVVLWGTTFFHKPVGEQRIVPWHRDGRYWPIKPLATTSVWIAVTDTTVENGCMWYLPGQHHKALPHEQLWDTNEKKGFYYAIRDLDDSNAVPAEVKRGSFAIHHCLMPHRSLKNKTNRPRRGIAMHFMDATMPDPSMLKILPQDATPVLRRSA